MLENLSVDKIYIIRPKPGPVAFFATGPGLGLIMYILSTLEFSNITLTFNYVIYFCTVESLKYIYNICTLLYVI